MDQEDTVTIVMDRSTAAALYGYLRSKSGMPQDKIQDATASLGHALELSAPGAQG